MDLTVSITAPSSVDSALCAPCNGSSSAEAYLAMQNNQTLTTVDDPTFSECQAMVKSDNHQPSSSASSTSSSGNYSASTPPNVFESTAFSSNYLCTLLANLEHEISVTQQHLDDENDKRHKYKVCSSLNTFKNHFIKLIVIPG
jgi:hypothetical protein